MPEQFNPSWEYANFDPEIQELLEEEAQYLSPRDALPTVDSGTKGFQLDGYRIGNPNHFIHRSAPEKMSEREFKRLGKAEVQLFDRECASQECDYVFKPVTERNIYCSRDCFHKERCKHRTIYDKVCARHDCARPFQTVREGQLQCSVDCMRIFFLRKRFKFDETCIRTDGKMKGASIQHDRICQNMKCGKPYYATRLKQKYCDSKCKPGITPGTGCIRKRLDPRNCANTDCQKEFQPKRGTFRYCSPQCRGVQTARERGILLPSAHCPKCNVFFRKRSHRQRYCSVKCFNQRNK